MATGRARVSNHGQNHRGPGAGGTAGGSDPAFLNIDSTANVGKTQGVRSYAADAGDALLSDGAGGSLWGPAGELVVGTFPEEMVNLAATRQLRGWWRVGEPSGNALDTSNFAPGDAADAPLTTGTAHITRDVTGALPVADDDGAILGTDSTEAAADYFAIPSKTNRFELKAQDCSFACWLKPTANTAKTFSGALTHMYVSTVPYGWGIGVSNVTVTGGVLFRRETNGSVARLYGPTLPVGEWSFIVGTYDTSLGHRLYVDGNLVAVDTQTFNISETSNLSPFIGRGLTIGVSPVDSFFYGAMDELSIWGDALTAEEVAILATAGGVPTTSDTSAFTTYGNYSIGVGDDFILAADAITATITLPTIASVPAGKRYTVKKGSSGTGTITVARNGATIDGAASDVSITTANQAREFTSDGSGWRISAGYL